jgi:Leucine-rich repeat (LRR) protein
MEELDLHWKDEDPDLGIESEGVFCRNMDEIIDHISEVKDTVKIINLENQHSLKEIPAVLGECTQLEELNISHTTIKEIPDFLFSLPNLRSLSCRCRGLTEFPKSAEKAKKLEFLHLRINRGWNFPSSITSLKKMKILILDLYSPVMLPKDLGHLSELEELTLSIKYDEGPVPSLPVSFNGSAIKKLNINDTLYKSRKSFDLEHAAHILSSCLDLRSLKISGFSVGNGHEQLVMLTGLRELELRHVLVEGDVFNSIASLHYLQVLSIWGSELKISNIPDIFDNFNELLEFSFAGNVVLDLPPSLYHLPKLKKLEIGSTGISNLDNSINNLHNLEILHIYDNVLEKLPDSIFTLPKLSVLNIDENIFNSNEIAAVKRQVNALAQNGQKIEFSCEGQGHRQMVKKLRTLKNVSTMDIMGYVKCCFNAINENPYAIKYVTNSRLQGSRYYAELCIAAVRKACFAIENINLKMINKMYYYYICMETARSQDIGQAFKLIKTDLLTDDEYIQVCIEAALHNKASDFLNHFNTDEFKKRFSREIYERICWVAVLRHPPVIEKMEKPTTELKEIAARRMEEQ